LSRHNPEEQVSTQGPAGRVDRPEGRPGGHPPCPRAQSREAGRGAASRRRAGVIQGQRPAAYRTGRPPAEQGRAENRPAGARGATGPAPGGRLPVWYWFEVNVFGWGVAGRQPGLALQLP